MKCDLHVLGRRWVGAMVGECLVDDDEWVAMGQHFYANDKGQF